MIIEAEVVDELRRSLLTCHHRSILRKSMRRLNHGPAANNNAEFSTSPTSTASAGCFALQRRAAVKPVARR
ncbi:hypothetical protein ACOJBM_04440 [Rhizobium beringeri]